jgi:hypothetical protein
LRPTVYLGHSPDLKLTAYRLNFGALPFLFAANIAEGFKKRGKADKLHFYSIAQGSIEESRYYLILAKDLEYGVASGSSQLLLKRSASCWRPIRGPF